MAAATWELAKEKEGQGFPSGPPALGGGGRLLREAPPVPEGELAGGRGSFVEQLLSLPRPRPPLTRSPRGSALREERVRVRDVTGLPMALPGQRGARPAGTPLAPAPPLPDTGAAPPGRGVRRGCGSRLPWAVLALPGT